MRLLLTAITIEDAIMLAYLLVMLALVLRAGAGATAAWCAARICACIAVVVIGGLLARATDLPGALRAVIYRVGIVGVLLYDYLMLRDLLPLVRPDALDGVLLGVDQRVFGVEPAIWLERFNRRPVVEWFSFFYFSYFAICLAYMVAVIWIVRPGPHTTEFSIGTLIVYCAGQLGYVAVPATGPVGFLHDAFAAPVDGGFFWALVSRAVQAGGAMKDIFPSIHTTAPLWFTIFAFGQTRRDASWRWPARVTGFFAANIVFSTVFLRWHYAVDVVAGVALALAAKVLARRLAAFEEAWRARHRLSGPWSFSREATGHDRAALARSRRDCSARG